MATYASDTTVDSSGSRAEIERTLVRFGARRFQYGWDRDTNQAVISFVYRDREVEFRLTLPPRDHPDVKYSPTRRLQRSPAAQEQAWELLTRQRWRALALGIKAKLALVEAEITSFEQEFLAATKFPDGGTVGDWVEPIILNAYQLGRAPAPVAVHTELEAP